MAEPCDSSCPECGAAPGFPCSDAHGLTLALPHVGRVIRGDEGRPGEHSASPYVTVTVEQTRESWQALLDKEGLVPQSYTPLGIAWSNLMQAIRDVLGEN